MPACEYDIRQPNVSQRFIRHRAQQNQRGEPLRCTYHALHRHTCMLVHTGVVVIEVSNPRTVRSSGIGHREDDDDDNDDYM